MVKTWIIENAAYLISAAVVVFLIVGAGGISGKIRKWKSRPRHKRRA